MPSSTQLELRILRANIANLSHAEVEAQAVSVEYKLNFEPPPPETAEGRSAACRQATYRCIRKLAMRPCRCSRGSGATLLKGRVAPAWGRGDHVRSLRTQPSHAPGRDAGWD